MLHSLEHLSRGILETKRRKGLSSQQETQRESKTFKHDCVSTSPTLLCSVPTGWEKGRRACQRWTWCSRVCSSSFFFFYPGHTSEPCRTQAWVTGKSAEALLSPAVHKGFPLSMQSLQCLRKPHGAPAHLHQQPPPQRHSRAHQHSESHRNICPG